VFYKCFIKKSSFIEFTWLELTDAKHVDGVTMIDTRVRKKEEA